MPVSVGSLSPVLIYAIVVHAGRVLRMATFLLLRGNSPLVFPFSALPVITVPTTGQVWLPPTPLSPRSLPFPQWDARGTQKSPPPRYLPPINNICRTFLQPTDHTGCGTRRDRRFPAVSAPLPPSPPTPPQPPATGALPSSTRTFLLLGCAVGQPPPEAPRSLLLTMCLDEVHPLLVGSTGQHAARDYRWPSLWNLPCLCSNTGPDGIESTRAQQG